MPTDISGAFDSVAARLCRAPLVGRVFTNPVLLAIMAAAVIVLMIRRSFPATKRAPGRSRFVVTLLSFLVVVLFVHHSGLVQREHDLSARSGIAQVFRGIEGGAVHARDAVAPRFDDPLSAADLPAADPPQARPSSTWNVEPLTL
jgi:hypothetical protein